MIGIVRCKAAWSALEATEKAKWETDAVNADVEPRKRYLYGGEFLDYCQPGMYFTMLCKSGRYEMTDYNDRLRFFERYGEWLIAHRSSLTITKKDGTLNWSRTVARYAAVWEALTESEKDEWQHPTKSMIAIARAGEAAFGAPDGRSAGIPNTDLRYSPAEKLCMRVGREPSGWLDVGL